MQKKRVSPKKRVSRKNKKGGAESYDDLKEQIKDLKEEIEIINDNLRDIYKLNSEERKKMSNIVYKLAKKLGLSDNEWDDLI
jgi:DNA-binding transcriptional regulator GbsR (MarR family)